MLKNDERMNYLFQQFIGDKCSRNELQEFYDLVDQTGDESMHELLDGNFEKIKVGTSAENIDWDYMFSSIIKGKSKVSVRKLNWFRIAAAAAVLILIVAVGYLVLNTNKKQEIAKIKEPASLDIPAPANNRAMITLADGRNIAVDHLTSLNQANVKLTKMADGKIIYDDSQLSPSGWDKEEVYNTLSNPKGSKVIDMTLADGSHVWLNAGSSVTYPIAFVGNERKVSITGEAYFEVAHDASKSFFVSKRDMQVQVLGTHFNVNAYDDENDIKVTLLEGSVKVRNEAGSVIIKPGEQVKVTSNQKPATSNQVDLEKVMAWKNGWFEFNQMDLGAIMRQVSRWYDVDIAYDGKVTNEKFGGRLSKNLPLSAVVEMMKANGVECKINGKTLVVKP